MIDQEIANYLIDKCKNLNCTKEAELTADKLSVSLSCNQEPVLEEEWLYVINFEFGNTDGKTLTLNNINKIIEFTNRPFKIVNRIDKEDFSDLWLPGDYDDFFLDNPNACLYLDDKLFIIELNTCKITKEGLKFNITSLTDEVIPNNVSNGALFIDATPKKKQSNTKKGKHKIHRRHSTSKIMLDKNSGFLRRRLLLVEGEK
ncbi:hypothetical protein CPAV1605_204 [seawater metagenome]|uniref:Uncharacterized protein n=1 Tax=seawater metagenome TaxID=1561972 RepID=A0A5E8CLA6_9ZZZZ